MFERFTDSARQVVVLAQEEARAMRHTHIGTEHVLLGLIREGEGPAALVLAESGVTLEGVRAHLESEAGPGAADPAGSAYVPFTARVKKVLELSLREALQLRHNFIGTEHILLGLIREGEGAAVRALTGAGVEPGELRRRLLERLGHHERLGELFAGPLVAERLDRIQESLDRIERHLGIRRTGSD